jgi:hypothetical protein
MMALSMLSYGIDKTNSARPSWIAARVIRQAPMARFLL